MMRTWGFYCGDGDDSSRIDHESGREVFSEFIIQAKTPANTCTLDLMKMATLSSCIAAKGGAFVLLRYVVE